MPKDQYSDLIDGPVERVLKYGGKTKTVWFRQMTSGERQSLLQGQVISFADGKAGPLELDRGEMLHRGHRQVVFTNVNQDGSPVFAGVDELKALPERLVAALLTLSEDVVKEEDSPND